MISRAAGSPGVTGTAQGLPALRLGTEYWMARNASALVKVLVPSPSGCIGCAATRGKAAAHPIGDTRDLILARSCRAKKQFRSLPTTKSGWSYQRSAQRMKSTTPTMATRIVPM